MSDVELINNSFKEQENLINQKQKFRRNFYQTQWKNCGIFLGCYVAERVLSYVFKVTHRMPYGNKGFDFICDKGYKIDVKSSCLSNNSYIFSIRKNKITDYFLCIGFDDRENLNPQHIWLIKGDEIIKRGKMKPLKLNDFNSHLTIPNDTLHLEWFSKYELTEKLRKTIKCCKKLKHNNK